MSFETYTVEANQEATVKNCAVASSFQSHKVPIGLGAFPLKLLKSNGQKQN